MQKCIKFDFGWGSDPDPAVGAYNAPPDLLAFNLTCRDYFLEDERETIRKFQICD